MSAQNQRSTALMTAAGDDRNGMRLGLTHFTAVHGILAAAMIAMTIGVIAVGSRAADSNGTEVPQLAVGPYLEVAPSVPTEFYVRVGGPPDALPPRSYIRIENLPGPVTLSEGQKSATGAWLVPLSALEALRLTAPDGIGQGSEFVVDLVAGDGSVLAERTVALAVTRADVASSISVATAPSAAHASASPSDREESLPPVRPTPTREERDRAEWLLSRGDRHVTDGNIAIARQFFVRAAELGLPIAAWRMAETYDPMALARANVRGLVPDPVEARKWYARALDLGMSEASARLQRLGTR